MLSVRIVAAGSLESSPPTNLTAAEKQRLLALNLSIESKVLQTLIQQAMSPRLDEAVDSC